MAFVIWFYMHVEIARRPFKLTHSANLLMWFHGDDSSTNKVDWFLLHSILMLAKFQVSVHVVCGSSWYFL